MLHLKALLILVLPVILKVEGQCPSGCRCPYSDIANCSSLNLTRIPTERIDQNLKILDISNNALTSLNSTSLRDMKVTSLVELNASRNSIRTIHQDAFLGQTNLQRVDLSSNNLISIYVKMLEYNPDVTWLSLSRNPQIKVPEIGSLLYSPSLKFLDISGCNIRNVLRETFEELPLLEELNLSRNKIEVLDSLYGLQSLRVLHLNHNHLRVIDIAIFTISRNLTFINLSHNWLHSLNVEIMPDLVNVVGSKELEGNPWECDCEMYNTSYSWCRDNRIALQLKCSSPPKFKGKMWRVYDKMGCEDTVEADVLGDVEEIGKTVLVGIKKHESMRSASIFHQRTTVEESETPFSINFMYTSIIMGLMCICLVFVALGMWCYLTHRSKQYARTGEPKSKSEIDPMHKV